MRPKIKLTFSQNIKEVIWKHLPKKTMYQTFKTAFDYLVESNKIIIENRYAVWIFNPELTKYHLNRSVKI